MANELTLPASFAAGAASIFKGEANANDTLGAGITASYAFMAFKGKVWTLRYQGVDTPLMRDDGDGPRGSIEVILVDAAAAVSKIYYKNGWIDGSTEAPDCWSGNGVTPDASVKAKVNPTCADCPMNAWGSKVTEAGKNSKMCADSRRTAIVPLNDIENDMFGGPMLLRVPAASLKDLAAYGKILNSYDVPYYAAATRISFDAKESFPKFVFSPMRPLTEAEAIRVKGLRMDKRVKTVLNETADTATVGANAAQPDVKTSPFEEDQPEASKPLSEQAASTGPATTRAPKKTTKPAEPKGPTPEQIAAAEAKKAAEAAAASAAAKAARIAEIKRKQAEELAALEAEEAGEQAPATAPVTSGGKTSADAVTMTGAAFDDLLDNLLQS